MKYQSSPLSRVSYFAEWGGRYWQNLIKEAIVNFLGTDLSGKIVLDVGTRYGKMACLFALLGAKVVGIDINGSALSEARAETKRHGVNDNVLIVNYDGDLDMLRDEKFDIIFTKSVLIVVPNLNNFLIKLETKLRPGGKIVFIENARGNAFFQYLRKLRHKTWDSSKANYFTIKEISSIQNIFTLDMIKKSYFYPIFLICGHKTMKPPEKTAT